uniref:4Fe-4S ferredoxin-type domain-containing protein n=1 Tax=Desulfacinum infernum TaxID=35837 RepID=A0A832EK51_9BACT
MKETPTDRRLVINVDQCIGCFACAASCPEKRIAFQDQDGLRRFTAPGFCAAKCDACRKVCPVDAVALEPVDPDEARPDPLEITWVLPLARCRRCGEPFTTEKIRRRLSRQLAAALGSPDFSFDWIPLCPRCRRDDEAHRVRAATRTVPDPLP